MVIAARRPVLALSALGALLIVIYALAASAALRGAPSTPFAVGLALDLTLTAAVATWWLGVRRGGLPRRAPLVVLVAGGLTARLLLAADASRAALALGATLELGAVALVVVRARRLARHLRADPGRPLILRLADALEAVGLPRVVARVATTEFSTLILAFTGWFGRAPRAGFSSHRVHGTLAIHGVLIVLIAGETAALHLLIAQASALAAWIATGSSIYAALWILGDAHALRLGRIRVERDAVVIEVARRWAAIVPRRAITAARAETALARDARGRPAAGTLALTVETPTVVLELSEPVTARGPFGLTRAGTRVALTVDDPAGFLAALER